MLTGNYVSLKSIIAKVYRDFGLKEEDDFVNFIEWGAEALEHIGCFEQLVTPDPLEVKINFYKGELPIDLVYLNQVLYKGHAIFPTTNTFGPLNTPKFSISADSGLSVNQTKIENSAYNGVERTHVITDTYKIESGYIKTSFEEGSIWLSYQALPLDIEGYPLVPDDVSFREATYRYIVYKYLYPQFVIGKVNKDVYYDAENKWYWYCNQAGAKAKMPDINTLESIKRSFLSLRPKPNQFKTFFEDLNNANLNNFRN